MAVLGREHLDIRDLNADSLTLSRSLDPLELFFDIPRVPRPKLEDYRPIWWFKTGCVTDTQERY